MKPPLSNCDSPYHLKVQHEATKLLRAFDPSLASGLVDTNYVDVIRYMCTACAWEASGAVSGKFRTNFEKFRRLRRRWQIFL